MAVHATGESLLLKQYLPLEFSRKIQWETLQFEPLNSRYVSENLKKATQADVFYKAQMGKETSFFYFHVERQSTADPHPYTMDWSDCFESSEEARRYLYQPILIDLTQESDRKIITNCPKTAGVHLVFKYIFARDFSLYQKQILKALQAAPYQQNQQLYRQEGLQEGRKEG